MTVEQLITILSRYPLQVEVIVRSYSPIDGSINAYEPCIHDRLKESLTDKTRVIIHQGKFLYLDYIEILEEGE